MTAIFFPWLVFKMWLRRVVLPLPRYPVSTVTGTRSSGFSAIAESRFCEAQNKNLGESKESRAVCASANFPLSFGLACGSGRSRPACCLLLGYREGGSRWPAGLRSRQVLQPAFGVTIERPMTRSLSSSLSRASTAPRPSTNACVRALDKLLCSGDRKRAVFDVTTQVINLWVAQVAQIFGGVNTLSGSVRTESVSAEFSTPASEP